MSTAHFIPHPTSDFHSLGHTDFFIFGLSARYAERDAEALDALACSFGAAFVGNCFVAHRRVVQLRDDYIAEVLTEISNHGLMPA